MIVAAVLALSLWTVYGPRESSAAPNRSAILESGRFREIFAKGNALYEQGNFQGAIGEYSNLVGLGVVDKDLDYNLGNAYYKTDDLGRAVLFYERAHRLAPRDKDIRQNLNLVREQLRDKQFVHEQSRFVRTVAWLHNNLNAKEMSLVASLSYLLLCILGIVFVFRGSGVVSKVYRSASYVSPGRLAGLTKAQDLLLAIAIVALVFVSTSFSAYRKLAQERERRVAIVLDEEASVYSGPADETTLQFKLHEGTAVHIRETRNLWVRIELPGGLSGWVRASSIDRV